MSLHTHVVHSRSLLKFLDPMRVPREEREKSKGTYSYLVYNTHVSPTVRHPALAAQQHDFFVFSLAATLTSTIHASPSFCALRSFRGRLFRLYMQPLMLWFSVCLLCSSVQLHTFCARVFFFLNSPPSVASIIDILSMRSHETARFIQDLYAGYYQLLSQ